MCKYVSQVVAASICSRFATALLLVMSSGPREGEDSHDYPRGGRSIAKSPNQGNTPHPLPDCCFLLEGCLITSECWRRQLQFLGGGFHGWQVGEEHNGGRGGVKSVSKLKSEHDGIFQVGRGENHLQLRGKNLPGSEPLLATMLVYKLRLYFVTRCSSSCAVSVFRCLLSPSMERNVVQRRHHSYGQKLS